MKKFSLFLVSFFSFYTSFSQISVDGTGQNNDATYLIEDVLINAGALGLDVSNISYSEGDTNQIGYFSNGAGIIGMTDGVVMSTGGLTLLNDYGNTGLYTGTGVEDEDLKMQMELVGMDTATYSIFNTVVIEFDFEAVGNSIEFDYVFASNEYPSFVCSQFNDIFGFFITGPGITGPFSNNGKNIALVPDPVNVGEYTTTPVTINTINSGLPGNGYVADSCAVIDPNWTSYSIFYVNNDFGPPVGVNQRGYTTVLTAASEVTCGETYHLKLAIADVADGNFNSSVFLGGGSFNVVSASTDQESEFQFSDSIIIEGCYSGVLNFNLDSYSDVNPTELIIGVGGTAVEGVDYIQLPDTIQIPPGDSTYQLLITPIVDNLVEGDESVIIYTFACNDTLSAVEFVIQDPDPILIELSGNDTTICQNHPEPIAVDAFASGGYVPYSYTWYYNGFVEFTTPSVSIPADKVGLHIVEVEGDCGYTYLDTFEIIHFPNTAAVEYTSAFNLETTSIVEGCEYLTLSITLPAVNNSDTTLYIDVVGGSAIEGEDYYPITRAIHFSPGQLTASINIEAMVDGVFEGDETIEIFYAFYDECSEGPNPEIITIISTPLLNSNMEEVMELCKGEEFTLSAEAIGGIEPYIYTWTKDQSIWSGNDVGLLADDSAMFYLTIRDACGYETRDSVYVEVPQYAPLRVSSDLEAELDICIGDALLLDIEVEGGSGEYSYKWFLDGIPQQYEEEYIVQDMDVSINDYEVVVTDHCGDSHSRSFQVIVSHCQIPNVMTPNSDGINDYFYIDFRDAVKNVHMHIYDRWGKLVFQSSNYESCSSEDSEYCWNGLNSNTAKECVEGIYFYKLEYHDGEIVNGTFSLMR